MLTSPRRRDDIAAAVDAYNRTHSGGRLPRPAARLLAVMFAADDVCQQSLDMLAAESFRRNNVPRALRALIEAGLVSKQPGTAHTPKAAASDGGGRVMIRPLSRRREIEAAIAAHNSADNETVLPPSAVRLLAVMFPRDDVCQRRLRELVAEGFDGKTLRRLLRALVDAGFLSTERPWGGAPNIYRLHLPPVRP